MPAPQVWIVAVPDVAGVHWKTCSGALRLADAAQLPERALAPEVIPVSVPPPGAMAIGAAQLPPAGMVVVVGLEVVVVVIEVDVVVLEVVVVGPGGATVTLKVPLDPPHEPAYPSITMK